MSERTQESTPGGDPVSGPASAISQEAAIGGGAAPVAPDAPAATVEGLNHTLVATHTYLGDVDDLEGSTGELVDGEVYNLPLLPLEGLVLCPGNTLPLRLTFQGDRLLVQRALTAPPPLTRLIAVVCCQRSYFAPQMVLQRVGCVAEIRKMGAGGVNLLAKGRHRVEVLLDAASSGGLQLSSIPVRVLPETPPLRVPAEAQADLAWHRCQTWRRYDAWWLAQHANRLFYSIAPNANKFEAGPLGFSYYLLSNMPIDDESRQKLLEAQTGKSHVALEA